MACLRMAKRAYASRGFALLVAMVMEGLGPSHMQWQRVSTLPPGTGRMFHRKVELSSSR